MDHRTVTPPEDEIKRLFAKIRAEASHENEKRLLAAIRRNKRGGRVEVDGYPSQTLGGFGSGGSSSVEAAVIRLDEHGQARDDLEKWIGTAVDMLQQGASSGGAVGYLLDKIDNVAKTVEVTECEGCAPAGVKHRPDRYARDLRGLTRSMHLCNAFYEFVHKHGEPPTEEQVRHYDLNGTWRVRVDPKKHSA